MKKKNVKISNEILELFSTNVARLRKLFGMSLKVLAVKTGLAYNFICDIENGKKAVSFETIGRLSKALEVEPYQLFLNPAQYSNLENQKLLGIIETLYKSVNRIFESSIKELTVKPKK